MQGGLSWFRLACKQASILPPPGCTSPHIALTSPRHSLAIAAAPTKIARHGWVRSAKCELRQDRMAPAPGGTSPHAALMSAAHSLLISPCCAIVYVVESNTMALVTKTVFSMGCAPDCRSPSFVPNKLCHPLREEACVKSALETSLLAPQGGKAAVSVGQTHPTRFIAGLVSFHARARTFASRSARPLDVHADVSACPPRPKEPIRG
jgi:hypothetical protein